MALTLAHLEADERAVMETIANCANGPAVGLKDTALSFDQRAAWLVLFQDGLTDYLSDDAGGTWLVFTERGQRLWSEGQCE